MDPSSHPSTSTLLSRARSNFSSWNDSMIGPVQDLEFHSSGLDNGSSRLSSLIGILKDANLPGPMIMVSDRTYLGQGAQFAVFRQTMIWTEGRNLINDVVAVKQPKFDLDLTKTRVDLADETSRDHIDDIIIEVRALTTPLLQRHRNIVRLLSWSFDLWGFHRPISLVVELADSDLSQHLSKQGDGVSPWQRYTICADVASGVDAIHDCDMVHGDLKPANVLLFRREDGTFEAKLADFGLSVGFGGLARREYKVRLRGTPGWQAPEVERGELLGLEELQRADTYSFGLLTWSICFGDGKPPPGTVKNQGAELLSKAETKEWLATFPARARGTVSKFLPLVADALHREAVKRPRRLSYRLALDEFVTTTRSNVQETVDRLCRENGWDGENESADDEVKYDDAHMRVRAAGPESLDAVSRSFSWELPSLPDYFLLGLVSQVLKNPETIRPSMLFSLFLRVTVRMGEVYRVSDSLRLDMLLSSARRGYEPAQAVVPAVFAYYEEAYPAHVQQELRGWLCNAVASGSFMARVYLAEVSPEDVPDAVQAFRASGGYGKLLNRRDLELPPLHHVASFGTLSELDALLDSCTGPICIDQKTSVGETALYLALTRDAWDIASRLLERGANAAVLCTNFRISCLHWAVICSPEVQPTAVGALTRAGANINSVVPWELPFLHWPFVLPAGTPLHWAVVLEADTAIRALIAHGARPCTRDGSDPYKYDGEIRLLDNFGEDGQVAFSIPLKETRGLSPLDYAAMSHDPSVFETLLSLGVPFDINDTDEEGLTVLHRLSASNARQTRSGLRYSGLPFRGSKVHAADGLRRTVQAVKSLGGDLNRLTDTQSRIMRHRYSGPPIPRYNYTPLMLAATRGSTSVVRCLVEAGADLEAENDEGRTAILCVSEDHDAALEVARTLIEAGTDLHHRDENGNTAVLVAANRVNLGLMELLLSAGADVTERDKNTRSLHEGATIWSIAARGMDPFEEDIDQKLAQLLEQYVLLPRDPRVLEEVVERPDLEGQTLLHKLASRSMRHSVQALIRAGADVNCISRMYQCRREDVDGTKIDVKIEWQETPLAAAVGAQRFVERQMRDTKRYSLDQYDDLCARSSAVVKAVTDAGGVQCPRNETRKPFHQSLLPEGIMRRRLIRDL